MKSKGQIVLPVFYKADPSEVRKQTGGFGEALAKHEANQLMTNKIQSWKEALTTAAAFGILQLGLRSDLQLLINNNGTKNEADLIHDLVKEVLSILNQTQLLHVAKHPVGLDSQLRAIQELASNVVSDGVNMVGIHGMGGIIGKTTLAKALYNKISYHFEAACFLSNVREASEKFNDLVQLQEKLMNEILRDNAWKVGNVHKGKNIIRDRLCSKKVLIVLDDVDKDEQLDALVGGRDRFGRGSNIIATTRDRHLLKKHSLDKLHPIQLLDPNESLELFSLHAFKQNHPSSNYVDLSKFAVSYCKGLPLGLVILGSLLHKRERIIWKSKLGELENSLEAGVEATSKAVKTLKGYQVRVSSAFESRFLPKA
ncbi:unnamed protein product [Citrullus colocynthis]|uniref:TMV resistance protein N-like n=1 Tax=Citrullus colocynthis TaxID=252529 RepID=A0ABP0Y5D1_9ROSI